jgi:hypothetical protein
MNQRNEGVIFMLMPNIVVCSPAPLVAAAISALDFLSCLYVEKCF